MGAVIFRGVQAETGHAKRQDLRGFSSAGSPTSTDPIAMGQVRCDTDGAAVMGRTIHNSDADTATTSAGEALPAYSKRVRLHLQNKSSSVTLQYYWGAVSSVLFELDPRETLTLTGDDCPADALSVKTASGSAAYVAADW